MKIYSGKRIFDLILTILVLAFLWPVLFICLILVHIKLGSPVLFRQIRPGRSGKPFTLVKFRTMTNERDSNGALLPDQLRLTGFGSFLRRTSLDELPELLNVLNGDMSLVGPRPLLLEYLNRYTPEQARRHDVSPGITGWAQVNGRQDIPFSKRIELDLWYVDNLSFVLDLKILFMTIKRVFAAEGVIPGQNVAEVDDIGLFEQPPEKDILP